MKRYQVTCQHNQQYVTVIPPVSQLYSLQFSQNSCFFLTDHATDKRIVSWVWSQSQINTFSTIYISSNLQTFFVQKKLTINE